MKTDETNESPVAQRLEELLRTHHLSKSDMSRIAGVSRSSVNGWFKKGTISKESASKIAAATGVSLAWVLGEDETLERGLSDEELRLIEVFRKFPSIERNNMLAAFEMRLEELKKYYARYADPDSRK